MDRNQLHQLEAQCVQENPPGCSAGCPVHVDVPALITAIKNRDYTRGFSIFARSVPFPRIISRICPHPCQQSCKRAELDDSIAINALEQFCVEEVARLPAVMDRTLPAVLQNKKIAVIGGGLSGLTAAWELAKKGYSVAVYEAAKQLGGCILAEKEEKLPQQVVEEDLALLKGSPLVSIILNTTVSNNNSATILFDSLREDYDACYLGIGITDFSALKLGLELTDESVPAADPQTLATSHKKVFAGGSLLLGEEGKSSINSIYHGKKAAISIDRFLQGASLTANRPPEGPYQTTLYTNIEGVKPQPACHLEQYLDGSSGPSALNGDPDQTGVAVVAIEEAKRCLMCKCLECVKLCPFLAHYGSYPKKYVREIHNNLAIVMGRHHANEMINSCSLCGLCAEICPGDLNMGEVCLQARRVMVNTGKMPPSAHDFALQDMAYSTSDHVTLHRHQPGYNTSKAIFSPGCQLGASSPQYVSRLYQYLREKIEGGVGLSLSCCGAPAQWAGREDLFNENLDSLKKNWTALGNPAIITGCPTCYSIFRQVLPDLDCETIWTVLDRVGLPENSGAGVKMKKLAVHDACTTRHDQPLQNSIRSIILALGHQVEELENSRETTTCCGYGGLLSYANRDVARKVVEKRIAENPEDYLAYCAICRDHFAARGKRTYHLLDLIFGSSDHDPAGDQGPGFSKRQENRYRCKKSLLKEVWGEEIQSREPGFELVISAAVRDSMEERMILTGDIIEVISHARSSGNVMENTETNAMVAYYKHRNVTYWVEFTMENESIYHIQKAYSHRVVIKG